MHLHGWSAWENALFDHYPVIRYVIAFQCTYAVVDDIEPRCVGVFKQAEDSGWVLEGEKLSG